MRPFILVALLVACTPSPEEVCEHWASLRKGSELDTKACVAKLDKERTANEAIYKCEAKCVMKAKEISEAATCREICH